MAAIIGKTTRKRRRRKQVDNVPEPVSIPEPSQPAMESSEPMEGIGEVEYVYGKAFCERMITYPASQHKDDTTQRRIVPKWVSHDNIELFHAFCVAHDILGTSYRPLECRYFEE